MNSNTKTAEPVLAKRLAPNEATLEQLAKLPKEVQMMALAYAQGVSSGRRMQRNER